MKKIQICTLFMMISAIIMLSFLPAKAVNAAESQNDEEEVQTETETEFPESYFLPIESNEITGWPAGPQIEGEAAVVLEDESGAFLYSKNMEAKEYPASITKIMTTLVAIENGDLDKKIEISDWALNSLAGTGSSMIGMTVGEKITLRQALYAVMLASANECANAVAEAVGGSEEGFAEMMNQKAKELGCINTNFMNAHGLHDENHYTCARDMAFITKAAMENKVFVEIASAKEYIIPKTKTTVEERSFLNHQKMLQDGEFHYKGCMGGKTGYTDAALNTLVTVAKRKERQLISVILRTNGPSKIYLETEKLLNYGFKNFKRENIPFTDGEISREDILGIHYMARAFSQERNALREPMIQTDSQAVVTIPKEESIENVKRTMYGGNKIQFLYQEWPVGIMSLKFNPIDFQVHKWELINTNIKEQSIVESDIQEPENFMEKNIITIREGWNNAWEWIYAHDIGVAIIILILILSLLPFLIVTYIRNRNYQNIRKRRQKEREERIKIEKDIDNKSVTEIEQELRLELEKEIEKEKKKKEKIEQEKKEEERLNKEIAETEKILKKQNIGKSIDEEISKNMEKREDDEEKTNIKNGSEEEKKEQEKQEQNKEKPIDKENMEQNKEKSIDEENMEQNKEKSISEDNSEKQEKEVEDSKNERVNNTKNTKRRHKRRRKKA